MPFIDIVIPAYNSALTLKTTVTSLQHSGLTDLSIIIINDGSTDNTGEVCAALEREWENVHCIHQENAGVSAARNRGIEAATGEYLIFFDADDSVDAGAFREAEKIVEQTQPDMLIFGMSFDYYHNGAIFRSEKMFYPDEGLCTISDVHRHFSELYQTNSLTSSCNKIIRRSLLTENHVRYPYGMFLMEDFLFTLNCLQYCSTVYLLPQAIYRYHQTEDEGNVYRRIRTITSLTEFVKPFEALLEKHPEVFSSMYYMLLRQKLWLADVHEIKCIAEDFKSGNFRPFTKDDQELCEKLKNGHYRAIRFTNVKLQLRHRLANAVKSTSLYQKLRGSKS